MDIKIDLSGIEKSINDIEAYKKKFEDNTEEFVKQTTDLGRETARANFLKAQYDGTNDVKVTSRANKKSGTITASGETALFIEFGTGISYPDSHPEGPALGMTHGSWSDGPEGKGHWDDPNGWYYKHGKKSKGNPANRCLYDAGKQVEQKAPKIAREVFK